MFQAFNHRTDVHCTYLFKFKGVDKFCCSFVWWMYSSKLLRLGSRKCKPTSPGMFEDSINYFSMSSSKIYVKLHKHNPKSPKNVVQLAIFQSIPHFSYPLVFYFLHQRSFPFNLLLKRGIINYNSCHIRANKRPIFDDQTITL